MLKPIITLLLIIMNVRSQSETIWAKDSSFFINKKIFQLDPSHSPQTYNLTFSYYNQYYIPRLIHSIQQFNSIPLDHQLAFSSKVIQISFRYYIVQLEASADDNNDNIYVKLAFMYSMPSYLGYFQQELTMSVINQNNDVNIEYFWIEQNQLTNGNISQYDINVFLTGFDIICTSGQDPQLFLDVFFINETDNKYVVSVRKSSNCIVNSVIFIRVFSIYLEIPGYNVGQAKGNKKVDVRTVVRSRYCFYPTFLENQNLQTTYVINFDNFFFGIKGFRGRFFNLTEYNSIFRFRQNQTCQDLHITYINIIKKQCPSSKPIYDQYEQLCYESCSQGKYQSGGKCYSCHYTCHSCDGPSASDCTGCSLGWGRALVSGSCNCKTGYYEISGIRQCGQCRFAIPGCVQCTNDAWCTRCIYQVQLCLILHPGQCNCSQINCQYNEERFDLLTSQCICKQQYYLDSSTNLCQKCYQTCFRCVNQSSNCLDCIYGYSLIGTQCIKVTLSRAIITGQNIYANDTIGRCILWNNDICVQNCSISSYFFNETCYGKCPRGYFNITYPYGTCQPCPLSCVDCFNYSTCYQCINHSYYYSAELLTCLRCSIYCLTCLSGTQCTLCQNGTILTIDKTCQTVKVSFPSLCQIGCKTCYLDNICQRCKIGYTMTRQKNCLNCTNKTGVILTPDKGCQQICGDNFVIAQQCDDGNLISGDGCNNICQIQPGYKCITMNTTMAYLYKTLCFKQKLDILYTVSRSITSNTIYITFQSNVLSLHEINLLFNCSFLNNQQITSSSNHQLTISFEFQEDVQGKYCTFTIDKITQIQVKIATSPTSELVDFNNSVQIILNYVSTYFTKYLGFLALVMCCSSLIPFNVWTTVKYAVVVSLILFDQAKQNNFSLFTSSSVSPFIFSFEDSEDTYKEFNELKLRNILLYMCLYFVVILVINQLIVRIGVKFFDIIPVRFPRLQHLFRSTFQNRFGLYTAIGIGYQPVIIYYCFVESNFFKDPLTIVLTILLLLQILVNASCIYLHFIYNPLTSRNLLMQAANLKNPEHIYNQKPNSLKYLVLFIYWKFIGIFYGLLAFFSRSEYSLLPTFTFLTLLGELTILLLFWKSLGAYYKGTYAQVIAGNLNLLCICCLRFYQIHFRPQLDIGLAIQSLIYIGLSLQTFFLIISSTYKLYDILTQLKDEYLQHIIIKNNSATEINDRNSSNDGSSVYPQ